MVSSMMIRRIRLAPFEPTRLDCDSLLKMAATYRCVGPLGHSSRLHVADNEFEWEWTKCTIDEYGCYAWRWVMYVSYVCIKCETLILHNDGVFVINIENRNRITTF